MPPYGASHNATTNPDNRYLQQDTVDAISNLATVTASDLRAITQIMATVTILTTELATVNKKLVVALQAKRASRGSRGGRNKANRGRGRSQIQSRNKKWIRRTHTGGDGGGRGLGSDHPLLLDMRPRMQAQQ